ncbi:hypothetical protein [Streptosporangium sp. NPDC051022]|uniref:hypothetical protein n=1 Tax=Streptosporangium sp. NPDC051022 TaxID=3155752 RepID=UPI0034320596
MNDAEVIVITDEQRARMKARLRELFGEPPQEMLALAAHREEQFAQARATAR